MSLTDSERAALTKLIKHKMHGTPPPDDSELPPFEKDSPSLDKELLAEMREHGMAFELMSGTLRCMARGCGYVERRMTPEEWKNI